MKPLVLPFVLFTFAPAASAQAVLMHSELTGPQAGNSTLGTGFGTFEVDPAANTVDYVISYQNLIGNPVSAHIHGPADPGADGGVVHPLQLAQPIVGTWNYDEALEADILGGRMFVNIHTTFIFMGEIRGQIVRTPTSLCECSSASSCGNVSSAGGCANSTGSGATLSFGGMPSASIDSLVLRAEQLPPGATAIFFMGQSPLPQAPFFDGFRCVGRPFFRFPVRAADASGVVVEGPDIAAFTQQNLSLLGHITTGGAWYFQCWYLDSAGPCGTQANATNALLVEFTP